MKLPELTEEEISLIWLSIRECQRIYSTHQPQLPIVMEDEGYKKLKETSEKLFKLQEKIRSNYRSR